MTGGATSPSLATDVAGLNARLAGFSTDEGFAKGLAFAPRPTDVFIATYPKCGTTLLQQIVHGLRTGGDLDFREITAVIPWIELAHDIGLDPEAEQKAEPRAFKTHLGWNQVPKGGRYIWVLRDPSAVVVSFYHFFEGWFFEPGAIDLETFALEHVLAREGGRDYWAHLASWWPHRHENNVLALCYEDVVADLSETVRRVAGFIGVGEEPERIGIATRQAGKDFMQRHPTLWDDNLLREARNAACGVPPDAGSTKVRTDAASKPSDVLTEKVRAAWRARWESVVLPVTGCTDYAALRERIANGD